MLGRGIGVSILLSSGFVGFTLSSPMAAGILNAYVVCATPRSGSTLLCEMLRSTGRAGRPLEHFEVLRHSSLPRQPREYFNGSGSGPVRERLPPLQTGTLSSEGPRQWWARILEQGHTDNGVWGGRLMWGHVADFLSRARELPGLAGADLHTVLAELLPQPWMVLVTRADKVAQAVSLWRALQTQRWRAKTGEQEQEPVYDFAAIEHLVRQLREHEDELAVGRGSRPLTPHRRSRWPKPSTRTSVTLYRRPAGNFGSPAQRSTGI